MEEARTQKNGNNAGYLVLVSLVLAIIAIVVIYTTADSLIYEVQAKRYFFDRIANTQGELITSNEEAESYITERLMNINEGDIYDPNFSAYNLAEDDDSYDDEWTYDLTIYTTPDVDMSFLERSFGRDQYGYIRITEDPGMADYLSWSFVGYRLGNFHYYKNDSYEEDGAVEWNVSIESEVSPEDQMLINDTVKEIAASASGSDADKVRIITNKVDEMINYKMVDGDNLADIIRNKEGCCRHYANLFYLACREAGVNARVICGEIKDGGGHAWNIVEIDGKWYHVDPTGEDKFHDGRYVLLGDEVIKENRDVDYRWMPFYDMYDIADTNYAA